MVGSPETPAPITHTRSCSLTLKMMPRPHRSGVHERNMVRSWTPEADQVGRLRGVRRSTVLFWTLLTNVETEYSSINDSG